MKSSGFSSSVSTGSGPAARSDDGQNAVMVLEKEEVSNEQVGVVGR